MDEIKYFIVKLLLKEIVHIKATLVIKTLFLVYRFLPVWYKLGSALPMFPKSEDNYEMSAHSILVLKCSPPVVIISTTCGTCYHCILLPLEDHVSLVQEW